jgi:hypothetical protein
MWWSVSANHLCNDQNLSNSIMNSDNSLIKSLIAFAATVPVAFSTAGFAQSAPEASVSVVQEAKPETSGEKKAEAIKLAAEKDALFKTPLFEGKAGISFFVEDTYSGKDTSNTPQNAYTRGYLLGNLYATKDLYLSANLRYSSSTSGSSVQNYFFDDGSAFFAELAIRYDADNYSLVAGKSSINYSLSRNFAAGIWGKSFAKKEYGVDGMMVLGGAYKIDAGEFGNHSLAGNVFMVDTTGLSDTYGSTRDPNQLSSGGPANTGKFNNYAISLDGLAIKAIPKFRYQLATVRLTTESLYNQATPSQVPTQFLANEQRYVASALLNKIDVGAGVKLTPLVEYNRVLNSLGLAGFNKSYYVGSLLFGYKQWNFGVTSTVWDGNWSGEASNVKRLIPSNAYLSDRWNQQQVSIGYTFQNGIQTSIGYKKDNQVAGTTSQTVGVNAKYDLPFAF